MLNLETLKSKLDNNWLDEKNRMLWQTATSSSAMPPLMEVSLAAEVRELRDLTHSLVDQTSIQTQMTVQLGGDLATLHEQFLVACAESQSKRQALSASVNSQYEDIDERLSGHVHELQTNMDKLCDDVALVGGRVERVQEMHRVYEELVEMHTKINEKQLADHLNLLRAHAKHLDEHDIRLAKLDGGRQGREPVHRNPTDGPLKDAAMNRGVDASTSSERGKKDPAAVPMKNPGQELPTDSSCTENRPGNTTHAGGKQPDVSNIPKTREQEEIDVLRTEVDTLTQWVAAVSSIQRTSTAAATNKTSSQSEFPEPPLVSIAQCHHDFHSSAATSYGKKVLSTTIVAYLFVRPYLFPVTYNGLCWQGRRHPVEGFLNMVFMCAAICYGLYFMLHGTKVPTTLPSISVTASLGSSAGFTGIRNEASTSPTAASQGPTAAKKTTGDRAWYWSALLVGPKVLVKLVKGLLCFLVGVGMTCMVLWSLVLGCLIVSLVMLANMHAR